jgi:hypothetical protein
MKEQVSRNSVSQRLEDVIDRLLSNVSWYNNEHLHLPFHPCILGVIVVVDKVNPQWFLVLRLVLAKPVVEALDLAKVLPIVLLRPIL